MHLTFTYWQVGLVVAIVMLPLTIENRIHGSTLKLVLFEIVRFALRFLAWPFVLIESLLDISKIRIIDNEEE